MPVVVRIARELYSLRIEELKKAISEDEEKFLFLVSEIDEIRAGKWDNQLLGLPEPTSEVNSTQPSPTNTTEEEKAPETEKQVEETITEEKVTEPKLTEKKGFENLLVQQEEENKVEADNLENEQRNVREQDVPPLPVDQTSEVNEKIDMPIVTEDTAIPEINISETPIVENVQDNTHSLKRNADDMDNLEEPELKRQRTEEFPPPTPISENSSTGNA
jgi:bromodomain-containing protein 8